MHFDFYALPSLLTLAALVAVFVAVIRRQPSTQKMLWLVGWVLITLRSVGQFIHFQDPQLRLVKSGIGLCALELASIAFVISVSPFAGDRRRQTLLALVLAVPSIIYTIAMLWDRVPPAFYYVLIWGSLVAVLTLCWTSFRPFRELAIGVSIGVIVLSAVLLWAMATDHSEFGLHFILAGLNVFAAILYWQRFPRLSAGVVTTVVGFIAGGAVPLVGALAHLTNTWPHSESPMWNLPKFLVAIGMILTLLENQIRRTDYLAYHDPLTDLPNRRLLLDRLGQAIARAERSGGTVAVLLLDLDGFKQVNDLYGHRMGDRALQAIVRRLKARMRATDTLARTGGDEFTVVSEITGEDKGEGLIAALENALNTPCDVDGKAIQTGVSIGAALYPRDGRSSDQLCAAADEAMYAVKRSVPRLGAYPG